MFLLLFHHALQRVLVLACRVHYSSDLSLGHLVWVDAALSHALGVNVQHDLHGVFACLVEDVLQDDNDEFHRRVVVVEQQHPVEIGPLGFRLGLSDRAGVVVTVAPVPDTAGNWNCTALSGSTLAVFTVFQSSARMPPVSPESGFHDQ